jgi:small multidrug resistance pump
VGWGWGLLAVAIVSEVGGTTCLKLSNGFTNWHATLAMVLFYLVTFASLVFVVKYIPVSVSYAIWSGVGTALIATIGMVYFKEPVTAARLLFIGLIIAGAVGLNLVGSGGH